MQSVSDDVLLYFVKPKLVWKERLSLRLCCKRFDRTIPVVSAQKQLKYCAVCGLSLPKPYGTALEFMMGYTICAGCHYNCPFYERIHLRQVLRDHALSHED